MKSLSSSNLVMSFKKLKNNEIKIMEKWFKKNNLKSKKKKLISFLLTQRKLKIGLVQE